MLELILLHMSNEMHMEFQCCLSQSAEKVEDHRRKWDREEYEVLAKERIAAREAEELLDLGGKREAPVKRDLLKPRDYRVGSAQRYESES